MAIPSQIVSAFSVSVAASTTLYYQSGQGAGNTSTTESFVASKYYKSGTYYEMSIKVNSNSKTAASTLVTRKNGADGNITISIPGGSTGFLQTLGSAFTDVLASGDSYNLACVGGAGGVLTVATVAMLFFGDAGTEQKIIGLAATGVGNFAALAGTGTSASFIDNSALVQGLITVVDIFGVVMTTNTRNGTTTYEIWSGDASSSAATGVVLFFLTTQTGELQVTSGGGTLTGLTGIAVRMTASGSSGTPTAKSQYVELASSNNTGWYLAIASANSVGPNTNNTVQCPISGALALSQGTVGNVQTKTIVDFRVNSIGCYISTNAITANSTVEVRVNGSSSGLAVSITASTTGIYSASPTLLTVLAGQLVNIAVVPGATGSMLIRSTSLVPLWINDVTLPGGGGSVIAPPAYYQMQQQGMA